MEETEGKGEMKKALRQINKLLAQDLKKKITVKDLEDQAKAVLETSSLTTQQKEFYRGFLRAIELLRKYKFLREKRR